MAAMDREVLDPYLSRMDKIVAAAALIAVLFLVGRGTPYRQWLVVTAVVLAVILVVVGIEQNGWWPQDWRTR
jgi:hypothetical protein